jgi:hypothetical protein
MTERSFIVEMTRTHHSFDTHAGEKQRGHGTENQPHFNSKSVVEGSQDWWKVHQLTFGVGKGILVLPKEKAHHAG